MKKHIISMLSLLLVLSLSACGSSPAKNLSSTLGVDLPGGNTAIAIDTHGGFHGDGVSFMQINYSGDKADAVSAAIAAADGWCSLPLSDNLNKALENALSLLNSSGTDVVFPTITDGYYCFIDRHGEAADRKDDSELFARASLNFTLALFDSDTQTLYCFEMDT